MDSMIWPRDYLDRVICGDCLEVMRDMPDKCVDLVLTDPPYGINLDTSYNKFKNAISYDLIRNDDKSFDPRPLFRLSNKLIIWGGNCFANLLPPYPGWLAWIKIQRNGGKIRQAEMELAWTNFMTRSQAFRLTWIGAYRQSETQHLYHPTQKPIELMRWCLSLVPEAQTILDPYCGSGTTLVACKELGWHFIGIEISREYCDIAEARLKCVTPYML